MHNLLFWNEQFLTIAILHLFSSIVCVTPTTMLIIADALIHIDRNQFDKLCRVFIVLSFAIRFHQVFHRV